MTAGLVLAALLATAEEPRAAPPPFAWAPFVQQTAVSFASRHVTAAGAGGGFGARAAWRDRLTGQVDANVLWGAGNLFATRLALGAQRRGGWCPAAWATFGLLWGDRIEVLDEDGRRPRAPVWTVGVRASPLRFEGRMGFVSALEIGAGVGPDGGTVLEGTLLLAGGRW